MGEAERAIRARERVKQRETRQWYAQSSGRDKERARQRAQDAYIAQIERLAHQAVAALRRADWDGATMLKRRGPWVFERSMAAWPVSYGTWQNNMMGTTGSMTILYLLANGRFAQYGESHKPRSFHWCLNHRGSQSYADVEGNLRAIIKSHR
jgi:hypothetical protein